MTIYQLAKQQSGFILTPITAAAVERERHHSMSSFVSDYEDTDCYLGMCIGALYNIWGSKARRALWRTADSFR